MKPTSWTMAPENKRIVKFLLDAPMVQNDWNQRRLFKNAMFRAGFLSPTDVAFVENMMAAENWIEPADFAPTIIVDNSARIEIGVCPGWPPLTEEEKAQYRIQAGDRKITVEIVNQWRLDRAAEELEKVRRSVEFKEQVRLESIAKPLTAKAAKALDVLRAGGKFVTVLDPGYSGYGRGHSITTKTGLYDCNGKRVHGISSDEFWDLENRGMKFVSADDGVGSRLADGQEPAS